MGAILQLGGGGRRYDAFTQMHLGDLLQFIAQRDPEWVTAMRVWAEAHARELTIPRSGRPADPPPAA